MKKVITVLIGLCAVLPASVFAETLKENYAGCVTERALDEMATAASRNDLRQMNVLLDARICFAVGGREFSMVDQGLMVSQVRVYAGSTSALLYVQTAATR